MCAMFGGQLHALVWSWEPGRAVNIVAVMSPGVQGVHSIGWVALAGWGRLSLLESEMQKPVGPSVAKAARDPWQLCWLLVSLAAEAAGIFCGVVFWGL